MKFHDIFRAGVNGDPHPRLKSWQKGIEPVLWGRLAVWSAIAFTLFILIYLLRSGEEIPKIHIFSFSLFVVGLIFADRILASQGRTAEGERKSPLTR